MSKVCSHCGAVLEDNALFCTECGQKFEAQAGGAAQAVAAEAEEAAAAKAAAEAEKKALQEAAAKYADVPEPEVTAASAAAAAAAAAAGGDAREAKKQAEEEAKQAEEAAKQQAKEEEKQKRKEEAAKKAEEDRKAREAEREARRAEKERLRAEAAAAGKNFCGPISTGEFFWLKLACMIPFVGLIVEIVLAIVPNNKNLRSYAKAELLWRLMGLVLILVAFIVCCLIAKSLGALEAESLAGIFDNIDAIIIQP